MPRMGEESECGPQGSDTSYAAVVRPEPGVSIGAETGARSMENKSR